MRQVSSKMLLTEFLPSYIMVPGSLQILSIHNKLYWLPSLHVTRYLSTTSRWRQNRGPLLVCLALAVLLSLKAPTNQASLVFAAVFITVCGGSAIVTMNAQLLGANISFFQSVCVLGYCIFPMTVSALVIDCLKLTWFHWAWLDMIWIAAGFLWATRASSVFIGLYVQKERRFLAVFPVLFFYTFVGWMILLFWAYQFGLSSEKLSTIIIIREARFGWWEWRNRLFGLAWQSLWLVYRMGCSHDIGVPMSPLRAQLSSKYNKILCLF